MTHAEDRGARAMTRVAVLAVVLAACGRVDFGTVAVRELDARAAGPIGWWKLDDGAGTMAADSSGNGITGVLTAGITWTAGKLGGAIDVDGASEHDIDLGQPAILDLVGSMTLSAWVNPSAFHLGDGFDDTIFARSGFVQGLSGWALKGTEDCGPETWAIEITGGQSPERCSVTAPATGIWYHVAGVYDAAALTLDVYVNGVLDDGPYAFGVDVVPPAQMPPSGIDAQIGNGDPDTGSTGGANGFTGLIDDVRIYDRVLTAQEIATLAQ